MALKRRPQPARREIPNFDRSIIRPADDFVWRHLQTAYRFRVPNHRHTTRNAGPRGTVRNVPKLRKKARNKAWKERYPPAPRPKVGYPLALQPIEGKIAPGAAAQGRT